MICVVSSLWPRKIRPKRWLGRPKGAFRFPQDVGPVKPAQACWELSRGPLQKPRDEPRCRWMQNWKEKNWWLPVCPLLLHNSLNHAHFLSSTWNGMKGKSVFDRVKTSKSNPQTCYLSTLIAQISTHCWFHVFSSFLGTHQSIAATQCDLAILDIGKTHHTSWLTYITKHFTEMMGPQSLKFQNVHSNKNYSWIQQMDFRHWIFTISIICNICYISNHINIYQQSSCSIEHLTAEHVPRRFDSQLWKLEVLIPTNRKWPLTS